MIGIVYKKADIGRFVTKQFPQNSRQYLPVDDFVEFYNNCGHLRYFFHKKCKLWYFYTSTLSDLIWVSAVFIKTEQRLV